MNEHNSPIGIATKRQSFDACKNSEETTATIGKSPAVDPSIKHSIEGVESIKVPDVLITKRSVQTTKPLYLFKNRLLDMVHKVKEKVREGRAQGNCINIER